MKIAVLGIDLGKNVCSHVALNSSGAVVLPSAGPGGIRSSTWYRNCRVALSAWRACCSSWYQKEQRHHEHQSDQGGSSNSSPDDVTFALDFCRERSKGQGALEPPQPARRPV